jgi:hypothetical protein
MPVPDVFELAIADSCACAEIGIAEHAASHQLACVPQDCDHVGGGISAQLQLRSKGWCCDQFASGSVSVCISNVNHAFVIRALEINLTTNLCFGYDGLVKFLTLLRRRS